MTLFLHVCVHIFLNLIYCYIVSELLSWVNYNQMVLFPISNCFFHHYIIFYVFNKSMMKVTVTRVMVHGCLTTIAFYMFCSTTIVAYMTKVTFCQIFSTSVHIWVWKMVCGWSFLVIFYGVRKAFKNYKVLLTFLSEVFVTVRLLLGVWYH